VTGRTVLASVDRDGRPIALPDAVRALRMRRLLHPEHENAATGQDGNNSRGKDPPAPHAEQPSAQHSSQHASDAPAHVHGARRTPELLVDQHLLEDRVTLATVFDAVVDSRKTPIADGLSQRRSARFGQAAVLLYF